ncbi:MAG: response regulator, partial [Gammaproteobacteria bacterium]
AILLDMNMPGGTGLEVLKRLKSMAKTSMIPIITFSGTTDPTLPATVLALGAEEFIPKPLDFERLFSLLCELIRPDTPSAR